MKDKVKKFIKLSLTGINKKYEKLLGNDISVILGSPGSGKTRLMEYLEKNYGGYLVNVNDFMWLKNEKIINNITGKRKKYNLLLLDGFDEYRIFETTKYLAIRKLANKIDEIKESINDLKIIISCRELDWYGDQDKNTLEKFLNLKSKIYYIEPLDEEAILEFAELYKIQDKVEFFSKYKDKGFLTTPQLFIISAELEEENIENKIELYEKFIRKAINESNLIHDEKFVKLSDDRMFEILGYLAYIYMFSNIEKFDEEVLKEISDEKQDLNFEILEKIVSKVKIFKNKKFIHKIFAEFLAARYLNELMEKEGFPESFIKSLFFYGGFIQTEFRGTFAWLCSISENEYFIRLDPFYQLLYGENNHFSVKFKQKILLSIKEYSKEKNPYFIKPEDFSLKGTLKGFYEKELDEFIMKEFEEGIELKNHYIYVYDLIVNNNKISDELKEFLFEKLKDNNLDIGVKVRIIKYQDFDSSKLKEILYLVIDEKIKDGDNRIRVAILNKIYPENLTIDELIEIIKTFKKTDYINIYRFLYKTPEKEKFKLAELLLKEIKPMWNKDSLEVRFWWFEKYLANFYYDLIYSYNGKNAKEIYDKLKNLWQYYEKWETIEVEPANSNSKKLSKQKLKNLANRLFVYYFENVLKNKENNILLEIIYFNQFFPLTTPTNIVDLCILKMDDADAELREKLFEVIIKYSTKKDIEKIKEIAEKYSFEKKLEKYLNPPKEKWQVEREKLEKKRKQKKQKIINENENFFKRKGKRTILKNFGAVDFISNLILSNEQYVEKHLTKRTFKRLKGYLKDLIFTDYYDKYIDLKQLIENIENLRKIDMACFASLILNNDYEKIFKELEEDKLKYLYLLSLRLENIGNIPKNKEFVRNFEEKYSELAKKIILEFIRNVNEEFYKISKKHLEDSGLETLKGYIYGLFMKKDKKTLVDSFISIYHFALSKEELRKLMTIQETDLLKALYKFKKSVEKSDEDEKETLTSKELATLYSSIFEYQEDKKAIFYFMSDIERIELAGNFLKEFDSEEKMPEHSGVLSSYDTTADFVKYKLLKFLNIDELRTILKKGVSDYWEAIIKTEIIERGQNKKDFQKNEIKKLKNFIFYGGVINKYDFFMKVTKDLEDLIERIERNENNEKNLFWRNEGSDEEHGNEEYCRDVIVNLWKNTEFITRETLIDKKRVDIEVTKKDKNWKVRIECKLDKNKKELITSVKEQLIKKYLENRDTKYGIYLVFYFGDRKKEIKKLKEEIENQIPGEWKENVIVKFLDLRR